MIKQNKRFSTKRREPVHGKIRRRELFSPVVLEFIHPTARKSLRDRREAAEERKAVAAKGGKNRLYSVDARSKRLNKRG